MLETVHSVGYVHRDIRLTNMIVSDKEICLIDWGYASSIGLDESFVGNVLYASEEILSFPSFPIITVQAAHDLHMLLRTFIVNFVQKVFYITNLTKEEASKLWMDFFSEETIWKDAHILCDKLQYAELYKLFQHTGQLVK
eukprot:TRINITY_DN4995_c0_g2_i1.p1 TRINITY_DN4995_c0_g2~~TRINITY_DN4995_c0_g2_i1.p1  ORF type:complete len:160 (+),score=30.84 TRINITY_DN4995_c0_g2_i1:62-481(+)